VDKSEVSTGNGRQERHQRQARGGQMAKRSPLPPRERTFMQQEGKSALIQLKNPPTVDPTNK
jgi:hypothetical protein